MASNKRKIFNDPVHGFITIPHELIFDIIEHPWFQRLRRIQQLALSNYVYPGANHTRFHHALGAFHLMRKAIASLKVKGQDITEAEELGAYIAILLHDIGHGPFSHTLEQVIIENIGHEELSHIYMRRLNEHFSGRLNTAIEIFNGSYPKKFLHQLVSSQLDVDRLDYLTRDSFFTGVNEGVISYDRIIDMMNVAGDELVTEHKGIYSIENFIIARRLMYWQVYLHKTVVCVEQMLIKAVERARVLIASGRDPGATPALHFFFTRRCSALDFAEDKELLEMYSRLDDFDVMSALKSWRHSDDFVLRLLCASVLDRRLFKIQMGGEAYSEETLERLRQKVAQNYKLSAEEAASLVWAGSTMNHAYNASEDLINILMPDGSVIDIGAASDQFDLAHLSQPVVKYYLCYPKGIS